MKKLEILNIHIVVSSNSMKYFEYLIMNMKHTAKFSERLFFYSHCLDNNSFEKNNKNKNLSNSYAAFKQKDAYRKKTFFEWKIYFKSLITNNHSLNGSNGHACGLNSIVRNMASLKGHNIIIDADCAILKKNWDLLICKFLKNFDIIGTNYEEKGGFTSGNGINQTYKKLPNPVFMGVKNGINLSDLDWMPDKKKNLKIVNKELSDTFNLPIGYELVRDVGWRLPIIIYEKNYSIKVTKYIPLQSKLRVLRTGTDYNQEYHFDKIPFLGHQRGSARFEFKKSKYSKKFYEYVEKTVGVPKK